jgi:hypothetical protein
LPRAGTRIEISILAHELMRRRSATETGDATERLCSMYVLALRAQADTAIVCACQSGSEESQRAETERSGVRTQPHLTSHIEILTVDEDHLLTYQ